MIKLTAAWNAQVPQVQNAVALHVFGVEQGQCPPGTFRRASLRCHRFTFSPLAHLLCTSGGFLKP